MLVHGRAESDRRFKARPEMGAELSCAVLDKGRHLARQQQTSD